MRSQRGQTAAEYLGVVVVIAVIVLALAQSAPGKAIAGGIQRKVCEIAGSSSCRTASPKPNTNGPTLPDAPNSGPAIGNGAPIPTIGWDGSASLTVEGRPLTLGGGKLGAGLYLEGSVELSRTACTLDGDGKAQRTYAVNGTLKAGAKADLGNLEVRRYNGASLNYSITTDAAGGRAIEAGKVPAPGDPTTIPTGTRIQLDREFFKGHGGSLSLKGFSGDSDVEQGRRLSSSVQRVDPDHLRIAVGDQQFVRNPGTFGFGPVFTSGGSEYADGTGRTIDIDLRDKTAVAAYKRFLATGSLPQPNATGSIGNRRDSRTFDASGRQGGIGVDVGPLTLGTEGTTDERHVSTTRNPDGTTTVTDYGRNNRVSVARETQVGPDGKTVTGTDYTLRLQGVDKTSVGALQVAQGGRPGADGTKDVSVKVDDRALNQLRTQAKDFVKAQLEQDGVDIPDDRLDKLIADRDPQIMAVARSSPTAGELVSRLLQAKTPGDALSALVLTNGGNADALAQALLALKDKTGKPLPITPPRSTKPVCTS